MSTDAISSAWPRPPLPPFPAGGLAPWSARTARAEPALGAGTPFSGDTLRERAKALSAAPYRSRTATLPPALEALDYDGFRDIRYVRERALWHGEHALNVEFFHMGYFYREPVRVYSVENGTASEVLYSPELFDFGKNDIGDELDGVPGFAGLRFLYPLNTDEYKDELGAFLGASYFRLLGEDMLYGLSARGLAIDTVDGGEEEFPIFREFYLEVPERAGAAHGARPAGLPERQRCLPLRHPTREPTR